MKYHSKRKDVLINFSQGTQVASTCLHSLFSRKFIKFLFIHFCSHTFSYVPSLGIQKNFRIFKKFHIKRPETLSGCYFIFVSFFEQRIENCNFPTDCLDRYFCFVFMKFFFFKRLSYRQSLYLPKKNRNSNCKIHIFVICSLTVW